MFEKIKRWYELELWTKDQVYDAVPKLITAEQYEEITGEPYVEGQGVATAPDFLNAMKELGIANEEN